MPKSSLASETVRSCARPFGSNSNVYRPSVFFAEIANAPLVLSSIQFQCKSSQGPALDGIICIANATSFSAGFLL